MLKGKEIDLYDKSRYAVSRFAILSDENKNELSINDILLIFANKQKGQTGFDWDNKIVLKYNLNEAIKFLSEIDKLISGEISKVSSIRKKDETSSKTLQVFKDKENKSDIVLVATEKPQKKIVLKYDLNLFYYWKLILWKLIEKTFI